MISRQVSEGARSVSGTTAVQAHRGSPDPSSGVRENTLAAFARARSLGADGVELDVRRTADGGLAVHHDPVVEGVGPVHELATADLPDHIPLLSDALEACAGMSVNIEVKNLPTEPGFDPTDGCSGEVVGLLSAADGRGPVLISSFWSGALSAVRAAGSDVPTALLVHPAFDVRSAVAAALDLGCTAVHLPVSLVTATVVGEAHANGLAVAAWTVTDAPSLSAVLAAGVDTVITDDVTLARRMVDRS